MLFIRCAWCHKWIFRPFYARHREKHLKLMPDGQKTDHVTTPPEMRWEGSLDGVPRKYGHTRCETITVMPEEIIRSYLLQPFLYSGNRSFCCGCGDYFPYEELYWVETGESLTEYFGKMRQGYLDIHGAPPPEVEL